MMSEWIYKGELKDVYKEFAVTQQDVADVDIWKDMFQVENNPASMISDQF